MERNEVQWDEPTAEELHGDLEPKVFLLLFLSTWFPPIAKGRVYEENED